MIALQLQTKVRYKCIKYSVKKLKEGSFLLPYRLFVLGQDQQSLYYVNDSLHNFQNRKFQEYEAAMCTSDTLAIGVCVVGHEDVIELDFKSLHQNRDVHINDCTPWQQYNCSKHLIF